MTASSASVSTTAICRSCASRPPLIRPAPALLRSLDARPGVAILDRRLLEPGVDQAIGEQAVEPRIRTRQPCRKLDRSTRGGSIVSACWSRSSDGALLAPRSRRGTRSAGTLYALDRDALVGVEVVVCWLDFVHGVLDGERERKCGGWPAQPSLIARPQRSPSHDCRSRVLAFTTTGAVVRVVGARPDRTRLPGWLPGSALIGGRWVLDSAGSVDHVGHPMPCC